jgi:hypothetical protein
LALSLCAHLKSINFSLNGLFYASIRIIVKEIAIFIARGGTKMENGENSEQALKKRYEYILKSLVTLQNKLIETNQKLGYIPKYKAMRKEIKDLGWAGICAKYHPDINIKDPAAFELFQLYKFVYFSMQKEK